MDKIPPSIDGISAFAPYAKLAALRRDLAAALAEAGRLFPTKSSSVREDVA
jgi:hypothetical protein